MTSSISWGLRMPFQVIMPDFGTPSLMTLRIWSSVRDAQNAGSRKSRERLPFGVRRLPPEPSALWQMTQFLLNTALPRTGSPAAVGLPANAGATIRSSASMANDVRRLSMEFPLLVRGTAPRRVSLLHEASSRKQGEQGG